jgi:hypothetical protein
MLPYVHEVSAVPSAGGRRIAVTLRPTASAADSAELARRLAAAPQVAGVRWRPSPPLTLGAARNEPLKRTRRPPLLASGSSEARVAA